MYMLSASLVKIYMYFYTFYIGPLIHDGNRLAIKIQFILGVQLKISGLTPLLTYPSVYITRKHLKIGTLK